MANGKGSGLIIRPVGQMVSALTSLFQQPPDQIRGIDQSDLFSPLQPVKPFGGPSAEPKQYQVLPGQNLIWTPRADSEYTAADLKALSTYPLARICIENVKDTVTRAPWQIQLRAHPNETRKEVAERAKGDENLLKLNHFFEYPDREHNWQEWLRPLLDDLLTIDAPAILMRKNFKGELAELAVLRGEMITKFVDRNGFTPVPPSPAFCFSEDTEVLTHDGWKAIHDVEVETDLIATRNLKTKNFEWQQPTAKQNIPFDGELIRFNSREIDIAVTPDHRMVIERLPHGLGGNRWRRKGDVIVSAEQLEKHGTSQTGIPVTSIWQGVEIGPKRFPDKSEDRHFERVALDNRCRELRATGMPYSRIAETIGVSLACAHQAVVRNRKRHIHDGRVLELSGDDYCALMGLYLSEGSCAKNYVFIAQSEHSNRYAEMKKLLDKINGSSVLFSNGAFILGSKYLANHLKPFGHAHEKFIPHEILNAPPRQMKIFWHYYWLGDGDKNRPRTFTCSKRLAGNIQELGQKIGTSAVIATRQPRKDREITNKDGSKRTILASHTRSQYVVSIRRQSRGYSYGYGACRLPYSGQVHCLTVPNGVIYVRRNGKAAWVGQCQNYYGMPYVELTTDQLVYKPRNIAPRNTMTSQLYGFSVTEQIAPEIEVGIARLKFVLSYYKDGSVPGVVQVVPRGTSPERIEEAMQWMNSQLAGNLAARNQWRLIQGFNEPGKVDQIIFSKEPLLAGLYDEKHIREVAYAYGTSPQRLMKMIRTEGKSSSDAAEVEGTLPWVLWVKGVIDYIIQRKMGLADYEIAINPYAEPDPLKNAAALTMLVSKAVLTPNEARKRVGEELRPEPEADRLGIITGTGFVPVGIPSVQAGVMIDEKGNAKPHPVTPTAPPADPNGNGNGDPNAKRGSTPISQEAGGGRSTGRNVGTENGKESLDGAKIAKKKLEKRLASRIEPDVLTPESQQAVHHIQDAVHKVLMRQKERALLEAGRLVKTLGNILYKRKFGNVQFNLSAPDAQKVLSIHVNSEDFAKKGRDMQPHVTILWGFHPEVTAADISKITSGIGNVDVTLGPLEAFPAGPDGVPLVIRIESEKLQKLNADLKVLPHTESFPEYLPHICIAYLKPEAPAQDYVDAGNPLEGEIFTLSNLVHSGIDYSVVELEKLMLPSERLHRLK